MSPGDARSRFNQQQGFAEFRRKDIEQTIPDRF